MRDEQHGEPEGLLQVLDQVQHLRLHRHVQRRDRLVRDDEFRLDGERAGDADALALAAGEFVREAASMLRVQPHAPQQVGDALPPRRAACEVVRVDGLADDVLRRAGGD